MTNNMVFFNKEGDSLNILYNKNSEKYEGKLFFDENSDDTFKTIGLYTFEKIRPFSYQLSSNGSDLLSLKKFQLFNEYGINFIGTSQSSTYSVISKVEATNNKSNYFSKWVYGDRFDSILNVGSEIKFNSSIYEFNDPTKTYTVVALKKGAAMILSDLDNKQFSASYSSTTISNTSSISEINAIKIYNYTDVNNNQLLSNWNQYDFASNIFINQKLSVVNSLFNNNVYTVKSTNLKDKTYYNSSLNVASLSKASYYKCKVEILTQNPPFFSGNITLDSGLNSIDFATEDIPYNIINTSLSFVIGNSMLNTGSYTTIPVANFEYGKYYRTNDLVLFDKKVYICLTNYTESTKTNIVNPKDLVYWSRSTKLFITEDVLVNEVVVGATLYLATNIIEAKTEMSSTTSKEVLLASGVDVFGRTLSTFNIDFSYNTKEKVLLAKPNIPSKYVDIKFIVPTTREITPTTNSNVTGLAPFLHKPLTVNLSLLRNNIETNYTFSQSVNGHFYFYSGTASSVPLRLEDLTTSSKLYWNSSSTGVTLNTVTDKFKISYEYDATTKSEVLEKLIEVNENLVDENNNNLSKNKVQKVVITDIDEFGLNIYINGKLFYTSIQEVYSDETLDMSLTIDKTINNFITTYSSELERYGILVKADYYGIYDFNIANCITFTTMYPNVVCDIKVNVGTTANFYLPLKHVVFYDMNDNASSFLKITVNNILYSMRFNTSIAQTLAIWVDTYKDRLSQLNIEVSCINNILFFNAKDSKVKADLQINTGKTSYLGSPQYEIFEFNNKDSSIVISSNSVNIIGNSGDFETQNFSTGQIVNVQNSVYPLNNKEYNITYLNPDKLTFSYQGAFFDVYEKNNIGSTVSLIEFNGNYFTQKQLNDSYSSFSLDTFTINNEILTFTKNLNTTTIYSYDINTYSLLSTTTIPFSIIKYVFNSKDSYLYAIATSSSASKAILRLDPITKKMIESKSDTTDTYIDLAIDTDNGDVYVIRQDLSNTFVEVFYTNQPLTTFDTVQDVLYNGVEPCRVLYNSKQKKMYFFANGTADVLRINSLTSVDIICNISLLDVTTVYYDYINGIFCAFAVTSSFCYIVNNEVRQISEDIKKTTYCDIIVNPQTNTLFVSTDDVSVDFYEFMFNGNDYVVKNSALLSIFGGRLLYNNIDGNLYITENDPNTVDGDNIFSFNVKIFSTVTNTVFHTIQTQYQYNYKTFNSEKLKIILYDFSNSFLQDVSFSYTLTEDNYKQYSQIYQDNLILTTKATESNVVSDTLGFSDGYYGTLSPDYKNRQEADTQIGFIKLSVREYIRFPRENYETNNEAKVKYIWKWSDDTTEDIFLYDVTGSQIPLNGVLPYSDKKLTNKAIDSNNPQTLFTELTFTLDYIDSSTDITYEPEPMQVFIGFNSKKEGVSSRTLQLHKYEEITMSLPTTDINTYLLLSKNYDNFGNELNNGTIALSENATVDFLSFNFKPNQIVNISILDKVNATFKKAISKNDNKKFKIKEVYLKSMIVEYIDTDNIIEDETSIIESGKLFSCVIKTIPSLLAEITIYGQTEIEDHRYYIELSNTGKLINPDEVYIFKEYDINEGGIDWTYLNKKRKEMILVRNDIFNYIGSYKAIINAINYFGYNDLDLYEYFRNINLDSTNYGKLLKMKIPDVFNNDVVGWKTDLFFENLYPNDNYEETNLFNLTYKITDEDGNNILMYSLDEVLIKLFGLKKWLERNVVPLTHKIKDIAGLATVKNNFYLHHQNYDVTFLTSTEALTPITAKINEVYKLPVDSGSSMYNVVVDFDRQDSSISQFTLDIRTYKVYDEWETFKNYKEGDIVTYYGKTYEAQQANQNFNPLKYQDVSDWNINSVYKEFDIVKYKRDFYSYQYLSPKNGYDYIQFDIDLYNKSNNIEVSYLSIATQSDYIARDIIDAIQSTTHSPIAFTYGLLSYTNYNKTVEPYTLYNTEYLSYDYYVGYNSQIVATTSTFTASITHNISVTTNPQANSNTIYSSSTIANIATIEFTPNISVDSMTASIYTLNISSFTTPKGVSIDVYYEYKPNQYSLLGKILENETNSYIFPFVNSTDVSKPKIKYVITTNKSFKENTISQLTTELNSTFTFTHSVYSNIGDSVIVEYNPNILSYNPQYQDKIAQKYFTYIATTASYVNIKPIDLQEANIYLNNMIELFLSTQSKYKTQFLYLNPFKNTKLQNVEFVLWKNITVWKEIDLKPVQKLIEHRFNGDILPYNFTLDSKIDPFVKVDVISDNGYGLSYKHTKTYEIRYNADK